MRSVSQRYPFSYFCDPLFLMAISLYGINRFLIKPAFPSNAFFHNHFNDILFIPAVLPLVLWLHAKWKLRPIQAFPSWKEIALHTIFWSILIEAIFPLFWNRGTADPKDIVAYFSGAFLSGVIWSDFSA